MSMSPRAYLAKGCSFTHCGWMIATRGGNWIFDFYISPIDLCTWGVWSNRIPRIPEILGSPRCFQTVCPHWSFCKIRSQSWWNQYCWLRMAGDLSVYTVEWCKSLGLSVGFVLDMSQHVSTLFQSEFTETWPLMHFIRWGWRQVLGQTTVFAK